MIGVKKNEELFSVPLDRLLFERFSETDFMFLSNLQPTDNYSPADRNTVLADSAVCPELTYPSSTPDTDLTESNLLDLKLTILDGSVGDVEQLYLWAINERLAKLRMLQETQNLATSGNKERNAKRFFHYSKFVYGVPEIPVYRTVVASLRQKLNHLPDNRKGTDEYGVLQELLGRSLASYLRQNDETTDRPAKLGGIEESPIDDLAEIVRLFQAGLQEMGIGEEYAVEVKPASDNISVNHGTQKIILPSLETIRLRPRSRQLTPTKIRGLIMHEIGTHALRRLNGKKSKLLLLGSGLDRYEGGEEGLATWREYQTTGVADWSGFDGYLSASLAVGLDNHPPRDFGEVYRLLYAYYRTCEADDSDSAVDMAWKRTVRTYRGTPGTVPGCIFTKDIVYRRGHIKVSQLSAEDLIDLQGSYNHGKYDPTSQRQTDRLRRLGVLME